MPEIYIEPATGNFTSAYRAANKLPMILWDNLVTRDSVSTTGSSPDHPVINVADNNTIDYWESSTSADRSLTIAVEAGTTVNCVAISRHNIASGGGRIRFRDGFGPVTGWVYPETDGVIVLIFPDTKTSTVCQVDVFDMDRPAVIYNLFVGRRMVIPSGIDGAGFNPIEFSTSSELVQNQSLSGNLIGNYIVRSAVNVDIPFNFVEQDYIYNEVKGFAKHYNEGKPFFMASSPSLLPNDAAFLWRGGDMADMDVSLIDNGMYGTFSVPATGMME